MIKGKKGLILETGIYFQEGNRRFYTVKIVKYNPVVKFKKLRGITTAKMTTDEIMNLTRDKA